MTYEIILANGDPLPDFITYNTIYQDMTIMPESQHVGEWLVGYFAIDDYGNRVQINFIVNVERKSVE